MGKRCNSHAEVAKREPGYASPGEYFRFLLQFKEYKDILQIGNTQGGGMMRPHAAVAKRDPG